MKTCVKSRVKNILLFSIIIAVLAGCKGKGPDVSSIKAELTVDRFEKDFFALDTNQLYPSMLKLAKKYPGFLPDFLSNIMGLRPINDTSFVELAAIKRFIADYRPVYDSAMLTFRSTDNIESELVSAL